MFSVYVETTEFLPAELEAFDTDLTKRISDEESKLEEHKVVYSRLNCTNKATYSESTNGFRLFISQKNSIFF